MDGLFTPMALLVLSLALIWLMLAAPLGRRTLRLSRDLPAESGAVAALHDPRRLPDWNPNVIDGRPLDDDSGRFAVTYRYPDRKGQPMVRVFERQSCPTLGQTGYCAASRVIEDSALDISFWNRFEERRSIVPTGAGARLTVEQTDHYRGLAPLLFRYFLIRREMRNLAVYLNGGTPNAVGLAEHPLTQVGLGLLSTLMLWPFFGLTMSGLMLSSMLTVVIVLHELGHMAAYRAFGHKTARMIFVPLLGGIAIGGRPYDSRFEVATCALMGAGMSAFFVPILIAAEQSTLSVLPRSADMAIMTFLLILGAFNLLNLLPMSRFDGGQVLRQVFRRRTPLTLATFAITLVVLWTGWRVGVPSPALIAGLATFTLVSLFGGAGAKPRHHLTEMRPSERLLVAFGLFGAVCIHALAIIIACARLFA